MMFYLKTAKLVLTHQCETTICSFTWNLKMLLHVLLQLEISQMDQNVFPTPLSGSQLSL